MAGVRSIEGIIICLLIHVSVPLDAEILLMAVFGLMHFEIALPVVRLCRGKA